MPRFGGLALALFFAGVPVSTARAELEIVRLWTDYKEVSAFTRLTEFITGREAASDAFVLRTTPTERAGFYYTLRLADREAASLPEGTIVVRVIPPDAVEARTFEFPFPASPKRTLRVEVGLTGNDWTFGDVLPLAWHLEIRDSAGNTLASRQSFLWAAPDKPAP